MATVCKTVPRHQRRCNKVTRYCLYLPLVSDRWFRQPFCTDIPRASPPVKTALLSTALQAGRNIFFIVFQYATEEMFIFCLSPCGWCETRRVMVLQAENLWARSRISRRLRHPGLVRDLHQAQGVYLGFCESVLQQKTQGVDFGFCKSYKICENLCESVRTMQSGVINVLQSYGILDGDCRFMTLSGLKEDFICNHVK